MKLRNYIERLDIENINPSERPYKTEIEGLLNEDATGAEYKIIYNNSVGGALGDGPAGNNLLLLAIAHRQYNLAKLFIDDAKSKLNAEEFLTFINHRNSGKSGSYYINTALTLAAKKEQYGLMKQLLDNEANADEIDRTGLTAAMVLCIFAGYASNNGNEEILKLLKLLKKKGADFSKRDNFGFTMADYLKYDIDFSSLRRLQLKKEAPEIISVSFKEGKIELPLLKTDTEEEVLIYLKTIRAQGNEVIKLYEFDACTHSLHRDRNVGAAIEELSIWGNGEAAEKIREQFSKAYKDRISVVSLLGQQVDLSIHPALLAEDGTIKCDPVYSPLIGYKEAFFVTEIGKNLERAINKCIEDDISLYCKPDVANSSVSFFSIKKPLDITLNEKKYEADSGIDSPSSDDAVYDSFIGRPLEKSSISEMSGLSSPAKIGQLNPKQETISCYVRGSAESSKLEYRHPGAANDLPYVENVVRSQAAKLSDNRVILQTAPQQKQAPWLKITALSVPLETNAQDCLAQVKNTEKQHRRIRGISANTQR